MEFWEQPDVVASFAARDPDHRLVELLNEYDDPGSIRVLDVGCAGGRNTVLLARQGFDVYALDASTAMVVETRRRVAAILGADEALRRIHTGRMDDLSRFEDASFDLLVELGVLHAAASIPEWDRAVAEAARVLRLHGRLLVAHFTPGTDLTGSGVHPVPGEPCIFTGLPPGRAALMDAKTLDDRMARHGFRTIVPSHTATTVTERGRRVSVNALYSKGPTPTSGGDPAGQRGSLDA